MQKSMKNRKEMNIQTIICYFKIILLSASLGPNCVQSFEFYDCTEEIFRNILETNNGTIQLEYNHYPGFWLSQVVNQNKKVLQWSFLVNEENSDLKAPSFVTIMDSKSRSYISSRQDRYVEYVWSWNIISKYNENCFYIVISLKRCYHRLMRAVSINTSCV